MKKLLWLLLGVAGGFVLAHVIDKDPRGHEVLADIDARIGEFTDRIADAYREQEARLSAGSAAGEGGAAAPEGAFGARPYPGGAAPDAGASLRDAASS